MSQDPTLTRLLAILKDNATDDHDWDNVTRETTFEAVGIDSLSILDLLYDVDQEFDIQLEGADVVDMKTLGEIAALLEKRQAEGA
ncbi:MAG: acyl carrier protein [Acidobacteriota bacterium]